MTSSQHKEQIKEVKMENYTAHKASRTMAVKDLFRELQPLPLYAMLVLTFLFFLVELVVSHVTHALTLLVVTYHTLVNLIALVGCLITVKYGRSSLQKQSLDSSNSEEQVFVTKEDHEKPGCMAGCQSKHGQQHSSSSETRLRNTFGWARIEVLVMLIGTVFLASLCFSLVVEAVQTLFHIGHQDEMHHPIQVLIVGCTGLLLNGLCYLLIGGYTFHQGSVLHVTANGDVVLDRALNNDTMRQGGRRLSTRRVVAAIQDTEVCFNDGKPAPSTPHIQSQMMRQGPREMLRDVVGCLFVIVCSILVYFTEQNVAKYVDPILSIISAVLLLALSVPYMKESGRILLQTIPDYIDIESLKTELVRAFPSLVNVHDVHIWCLTPTRIFATAHLVLRTHEDYVQIKVALDNFFHERGITQATIQPEFYKAGAEGEIETECYLQCRGEGCLQRHCCQSTPSSSAEDLQTIFSAAHGHSHGGHGHSHGHKKAHSHDKSHGHSQGKAAKHRHSSGHSHKEHAHSHSSGHDHKNPVHSKEAAIMPPPETTEVTDVISIRDSRESSSSCSENQVIMVRQRSQSESQSSDCMPKNKLEECDIPMVKQQSLEEGLDQLKRAQE